MVIKTCRWQNRPAWVTAKPDLPQSIFSRVKEGVNFNPGDQTMIYSVLPSGYRQNVFSQTFPSWMHHSTSSTRRVIRKPRLPYMGCRTVLPQMFMTRLRKLPPDAEIFPTPRSICRVLLPSCPTKHRPVL